MNTTLSIYRPKGSLKVTCKRSGAFAFVSEYAGRDGVTRFSATGFLPKAARNSAFNYSFKTAIARDKHVAEFFAGVAARAERTRAARAERFAAHTLEVGHIFQTSWGYDQTNVEFFQVVEIVGKNSVRVREICSSDVTGEGQGSHDSGRCLPAIDAFKGEPMLKRVSMSGKSPRITIDDVRSARLWDGKPAYYSWGH